MESLGRSVLERYLERLRACSVDIAEFACKLRVKGLITDADVVRALSKNVPASEQWGDLVATITKNSTQGIFQRFIDALLEERELEQLGKEMKDTYTQTGGVWIEAVHHASVHYMELKQDISDLTRQQQQLQVLYQQQQQASSAVQYQMETLYQEVQKAFTQMHVAQKQQIEEQYQKQEQKLQQQLKQEQKQVQQQLQQQRQLQQQQQQQQTSALQLQDDRAQLLPLITRLEESQKKKYQKQKQKLQVQQQLQQQLQQQHDHAAAQLKHQIQDIVQQYRELKQVVDNLQVDQTQQKVQLQEQKQEQKMQQQLKEGWQQMQQQLQQQQQQHQQQQQTTFSATQVQHELHEELQYRDLKQDIKDIKDMQATQKEQQQHLVVQCQQQEHNLKIQWQQLQEGLKQQQQAFSDLQCDFEQCKNQQQVIVRTQEQQKQALLELEQKQDTQLETHMEQHDVFMQMQATQHQYMWQIQELNQKQHQLLHHKWSQQQLQQEQVFSTQQCEQKPSASDMHLKSVTSKQSQQQKSAEAMVPSSLTVAVLKQSGDSHAKEEECLSVISSRRKQCEELFSLLGLADLYPQRLTLQHSLEIREDTIECGKHLHDTGRCTVDVKKSQKFISCTDPRLYPFLILQRIKAFDYRCRKKLVLSSELCFDQGTLMKTLSVRDSVGETELVVNPMDGLLAVLHCADNFLRQDLMSRLSTCQLAIPLLLPDPSEPQNITFPLWAMRSIVREWYSYGGTSTEGQLVTYSSPLVSFLRIGKLKVSKSQTMNSIISESKDDIFFHFNCDGGKAKHILVSGLVEMCWYLPSKGDRIFPDLVTFANLHGDACRYSKQTKFLSKVSFMNFVFINDSSRGDEALKVLKSLAKAPGGLILLQVESSHNDDAWHKWLGPLKENVQVLNLGEMNEADYCEEIREEINSKITKTWSDAVNYDSLEKYSDVARLLEIHVDQDEDTCKEGKEVADVFQSTIHVHGFRKTHTSERLKSLLPLQSTDLWHEWASANKEQYRQTHRGQDDVQVYSEQQRRKMERIRKEQSKKNQWQQPLMNTFITSLQTLQREAWCYFLKEICFFLDNLSREELPSLHSLYKDKILELQTIQLVNDKTAEEACNTEIQKLSKQIVDASFGLEHLLREISQVYEAEVAQMKVSQKNKLISRLPEVAAKLMIEGYPLELMDGDAAHVPITWVSAVLSKVQEILNNPKVFVISVLGIQSSGKSTLLNTVFGVQFNTSAGRCTCGAFMQLLPLHSSLQQECNCNYILIVDTEGLRAPELANQTHKHDNELATFVIGLANLTIINLSGETVGDMDDILQTAVHAFLRMKTVRLKPSCYFVHQNVTAVKAREKTMMGHMRFKEALDMNTQAAAKEEGLEDKYKHFTDVIDFDSEKHVFYFQNLWKGNPPMAPINPGYSTNAQLLKGCLITHAKQACSTDLQAFQKHLRSLWQAILHENFVFSFKNTLEVTAYNALDVAYSNWSWQFKQDMMTWEQRAHNRMRSCERPKLSSVYSDCIAELPAHAHDIHQALTEEMNSFFKKSAQQEIIIKWKGEIETRLVSLKMQLKQQAEDRCKFWKTSREALAKVDDMKITHREIILGHVQRLASQLEKKTLSDKQLEERFNEQWIKWIDEIKSLPVHMVNVDVKGDVQKCLTYFESLKRCQHMVITKLEKNPLDRGDHNLQLIVRDVHVKRKTVYKMKVVPWSEYPIEEGQEITNTLLEHQKEHLQQMRKEHYNPNLANDLLHKLFDDIYQNSTDVTFTEEYKVEMALTVCRHALMTFQEMVDTERKRNDPVDYLERELKEPFLKIFKDEYNEIAQEITAAVAICDLLLNAVKEEIFASLSRKIAEGVRGVSSFLQSKPALKAKILLDIGNKLHEHSDGHFEDCVCYLRDINRSLHSWLEQYTFQYCHEGKFAEIACTQVSEIVELVKHIVREVTKEFTEKACKFVIAEWLTKFHIEIQKSGKLHLNATELHQLGGIHQLKDVSGFNDEVIKGLASLQSKLLEHFEDMPLAEMDKWSKKPHDHLFESLAGCTEQCPFCKEQCDLTDPNHYPSTKHSVAMHRPKCLGGFRWNRSRKMVLDLCTTGVGSDKSFQNRDTGGNFHPYKEYSTIYPQWSIPADLSLEASSYWKWLLGHYSDQIAETFGMERGAIPSEWENLHWNDVKETLSDAYNV